MSTYTKFFIFSILIFGSKLAIGQQKYVTITGQVKDSVTNVPMANATVNINYGQKLILTDSLGNFKFNIRTGEITLVTKYVNYIAWRSRFIATKDTNLVAYMKDFSNDLEQVTVSSKSADKNVRQPVMGVSSLNIKELKRMPTVLGEIDVLRGLQMLPGVTTVGEASNGVNVRGGTTDQNLMLLDEAPIFNPTHMFGLFSAFPSDAISSFDLYKGTVPSRFGGRAAGVLDVSIANPSLTRGKKQFALGLVSQKALIDMPIIKDKLGLLVSGRLAVNDFLLPLVSDQLDGIKSKFGDGAAKLFYRINNKNTLSFTTYYSADFLQTDVLGTINDINSSATQYDYRTLNFSGKWLKVFNNNLNLQTILVSSNYTPKTLLPEFQTDNKVEIYTDIKFKQVRTNLNYTKGNQRIEFGVDAAKYDINPGEIRPNASTTVSAITTPLENGLELGAFVEDEFAIGAKLKVSAGLRYSYYSTYGPNTYNTYDETKERLLNNATGTVSYDKGQLVKSYGGFEPRLGINWVLSDESSIKFGYNTMRQYLQVISNTTTPIPTSRWKSSDQFIKPQVSQLYSAGYFKNINDNIYELSTELYYKTTNNIVEYKPGADFLLNKNIETELLQGFNKSYGLELMMSKKKGEMTGWVNYTYSRSLNQVNEGPGAFQQVNYGNWYASNYDRPHTFNAAIVINQSKIHDFSFNFTYSSGRPFTTPKALPRFGGREIPFYAERNNDRIPDYHRLDFAWNIYNPAQKSKKFKGNWNFTIYNLYGRKNAYSVFFKNEGNLLKANKLIIFGAPIPSISYNFKFE